ncbi:uncharacterized protein A1O9_09097 [Exophiala aquamarina CBS 119918]|uniref:KANL3/Tex30 alpha/beta hydrolase-like domain-containing protein n=1 Tax=Exophiala aquamarina CBS 119918 TaxID=1182545 RepID=A0A072PGH9_9EURO|nr:uncharacterized protein A1O9_09097 [Exophiala aquamarina CBS 119918]KEF54655.1 hypothetical protein A1O9_09097 [Exophiala aquamarina CBS 119918]
MAPKTRGTRSGGGGVSPSSCVKRARKQARAGADADDATSTVDDRLPEQGDTVALNEKDDAQPAKPNASPLALLQDAASAPEFTSYNVSAKPRLIPCRKSLHPRMASDGSTVVFSPRSPPDLIFTHGAGGDLNATAMVNFSYGFASAMASIIMFQGPMNLERRAAGFAEVLDFDKRGWSEEGEPGYHGEQAQAVAFGGRSMGARAAVVASQAAPAAGSPHGKLLILASYPLVSPKGDLRDAILLSLPAGTCVLFISGDRDNMCPVAELAKVRAKMTAKTWLVTVVGADHGMDVRGGSALKKGTEEVGRECGRIAARWLRQRDDGVREMRVRWDGERGKVLGSWGNDKDEAGREKGQSAGIKRFFSKVDPDPKDLKAKSAGSRSTKNRKTKT